MRQVDKAHIKYHLDQLLGHCDNQIHDIRLFWDLDKLVRASVWYDGGHRRDIDTKGLKLSAAFEKIMEAI